MNVKELRELNVWIAEHVFGGIWYRFKDLEYLKRSDPTDGAFIVIGIDLEHFASNRDYCPDTGELPRIGFSWIPKYTTDPAAAMEVLEKIGQITWPQFTATRGQPVKWIYTDPITLENKTCDTLPLAICLFARELFSKKRFGKS